MATNLPPASTLMWSRRAASFMVPCHRMFGTASRGEPRRAEELRGLCPAHLPSASVRNGRTPRTTSTRRGITKLLPRRSSSRRPSGSSRTNPGTRADIAPTSSPTRSPRPRTIREKWAARSTSMTSGAGRHAHRGRGARYGCQSCGEASNGTAGFQGSRGAEQVAV